MRKAYRYLFGCLLSYFVVLANAVFLISNMNSKEEELFVADYISVFTNHLFEFDIVTWILLFANIAVLIFVFFLIKSIIILKKNDEKIEKTNLAIYNT
ncbi:hypothetical protein A4S06_09145 [Erysipelotrichaceae bacterium MTC7]|nr:hypothetical protein A4S06_09145 [Erysipelotrichaceae bacterium MTC7]